MLSLMIFALVQSARNYINTPEFSVLNSSSMFTMPDFSSSMFTMPNLSNSMFTMPDFSTWNSSTVFTMPELSVPELSVPQGISMLHISMPDMAPYALYYFLTGAAFFLGSAWILMTAVKRERAIDGIASMTDFTKTKLRKSLNGQMPNREVLMLIEENGMEFEEFLNRLGGNRKRIRRSSPDFT